MSLKPGFPIARAIAGACDCIGAFLLAIYAFLVVGPLGFLRGPLVFERFFWYVRVLVPTKMMARSVRVAIDWRLGHFDVAIAQAEEVIAHVEEYYNARKSSVRKRVLGDLYTLLSRAYMHAGHMDEAMQVILRAHKCLGVDRLPGIADLDAKTAHLVRAGIAAGRLLEGGGLATMFVKADPRSQQPKRPRSGATAAEHDDEELPQRGAKIIPFPTREENF